MILSALQHVQRMRTKYINEMVDFISIPSISTDETLSSEVTMAANWLADYLRKLNISNIQVCQTGRHPVVIGEYKCPDNSSKPTVLVYGHYDVQPVDPLDKWKSDPFTPVIKNESLYGRGASDMKGQIMACLAAIDSLMSQGELQINIKFLFEGEEEIGSPSLEKVLNEHSEFLSADIAFNPDAGMIAPEKPTITYGLRGMAAFELNLFGPDHDLHSGQFGGVVHNPAQVLCELIAKMHDPEGRVSIPRFYDDVIPLLPEDRKLALLHDAENEINLKKLTGVSALWGDPDFAFEERVGSRPTLEINGIQSGFTGQGMKTIIPAQAMAKISTRLVPDQDPHKIRELLTEFIKGQLPNTIKWDLIYISGSKACITDRTNYLTKSYYDALKQVWGVDPVYKREGGSIPVVGYMQKILKIDSVLSGFALPDDNIHAPNEKLDLGTWYKGIDSIIHYFYSLGLISK